MKKWITMGLTMLLLTGCGAAETFETVTDVLVQPAAALRRDIVFSPPADAAIPSMVSDEGDRLYLCGKFVLTTQTRDAGDLAGTVRAVSGYDPDGLTILETDQDGLKRYDFTWVSAGEGGNQVGRAAVLDDGSYHYILSVMAPEADSGELSQTWDVLLRSFSAV